MGPTFAFVVFVSMVKDAVEDYQRHVRDKKENDSLVDVFDRSSRKFVQKKWQEVKVGDLIHLKMNDSVPADILALWSNEDTGQIFVETKSLDGETNLKIK